MAMNKLTKFMAAIALTAIYSGDASGQAQVPNDFQAGQPARAAEVNANFDALETAVNQNAAGIATNVTEIASNDSEIAAVGAITSNNIVEIQNNASNVADNLNEIQINSANIEDNTGAIETNSSDISSNATAIVGLISGGGIQVFSQGSSIGRFIGTALVEGTRKSVTSDALWVLSDQGFIFAIDGDLPGEYLAEVGTLFFANPGCTGDSFVHAATLRWTAASGAVFQSPSGWVNRAYYTPRGETGVVRTTQSEYQTNSGCVNSVKSNSTTYRALPNDDAVTGVSNTAPNRPLTIGLP